jgi:hypothetical protein
MGKFKPGQSGNPKGRPAGVRSFQSNTLLLLKAESMANPVAFLTGVYRSPQAPDQLRVTAALGVAPYVHVRATDRRISMPIDLPKPETAEIANANIAELIDRVNRGQLGVEEGEVLVRMQNAAIASLEGSVLSADFAVVERTIAANPVEGGLPRLPGLILPNVDPPANPGPWEPKKDDQ